VGKGTYDKQIGMIGETSCCLAELQKIWRNCLSFHRFCMQKHWIRPVLWRLRDLGWPQGSLCRNTSKFWALLCSILGLPRGRSSVIRCSGDLNDCPCREFSGSLCSIKFQWDFQRPQQAQIKVGSQDPFIMEAQNRSRSMRPWIDSHAEVLRFLTLLTPVVPSLYLVT
jgi:hypothetical protein